MCVEYLSSALLVRVYSALALIILYVDPVSLHRCFLTMVRVAR